MDYLADLLDRMFFLTTMVAVYYFLEIGDSIFDMLISSIIVLVFLLTLYLVGFFLKSR